MLPTSNSASGPRSFPGEAVTVLCSPCAHDICFRLAMKMNEDNLDHYPVGTTALVWTIMLHMDQKRMWDLTLTFFPCIT